MHEPRLLAVVDTNVWISAFINETGAPARVLDAFLGRRFSLIISAAFLDEIEEVVKRPRIRGRCRFGDAELAAIFARFRDAGILAFPIGAVRLCRDPEDDFLLETAVLGGAQYVVSRDDDIKRDLDLIAHLRERGIDVLSVAQFLDLLAARAE